MKRTLILSMLLLFIVSANAQYYRSHQYNNYPAQQQVRQRVKIDILPILGAIITTAIISNQLNDYDNHTLSTREIMRQHYYQNQLNIQRLELLQRQDEIMERQQYRRERGVFGIFHKRRHRY